MRCKCGSETFFEKPVGQHLGLYCSGCGSWKKWVQYTEPKIYFGKYAGTPIFEITDDRYLMWLLDNVKLKTTLRLAIQKRINQINNK